MSIEIAIWVLGGTIGVIGMLVATLWQMTRAEQKAQDEAIARKADSQKVEEGEKRFEKEVDRLRFEHEKVINRVEGRFEKELENVESRIISRFDSMEANFVRQFEILMEIVKKDRV